MTMRKKLTSWIWLMMPEDSSNWGPDRSFVFNLRKTKRTLLSITKVLLWYGVALSLTLLIGRLH